MGADDGSGAASGVLGRLDLLLIVAPLSVLFSYRLVRVRSRSRSVQR